MPFRIRRNVIWSARFTRLSDCLRLGARAYFGEPLRSAFIRAFRALSAAFVNAKSPLVAAVAAATLVNHKFWHTCHGEPLGKLEANKHLSAFCNSTSVLGRSLQGQVCRSKV